MALRFADSFDHYATAEILQKHPVANLGSSGATVTISAGNGRNSTQSGRLTHNSGGNVLVFFSGVVAASGATAILGAGVKLSAVDASAARNGLFSVYDAGTAQITVIVNSDFTLSVVRGTSSGTVLGTSTGGIGAGNYYYVEFKTALNTSTGTYELKVNGTTVLSGSGANTAGAGTTTWNAYRFGLNHPSPLTPGSGAIWDYDDIYVADGSGSVNNDFLGPIRVKAVLPDGAGTTTNFTPSTGSNYQNVDDTLTDGDSTYNSESTAGELDLYTFAAVGITGTVKAVQTNLMVRSNGAGSETIAPMFRISSTNYAGTTVGVSTSYLDKMQVYETSPATAAAWTVSEIDGAESGIKLVS